MSRVDSPPHVQLDHQPLQHLRAALDGLPERRAEGLGRLPHLGHVHRQPPLGGVQSTPLVAVAVALGALGAALVRRAAQRFGHLGLQQLLDQLAGSQPHQLVGQVLDLCLAPQLLGSFPQPFAWWYPRHGNGRPSVSPPERWYWSPPMVAQTPFPDTMGHHLSTTSP